MWLPRQLGGELGARVDAELAVARGEVRLDGLDGQEELLRDRAVALARRRRARRPGAGAGSARRRPRAPPGAGAGRSRRARAGRARPAGTAPSGVGVGQRGAQRVARLDAAAQARQRAAQLEPHAHAPRAAPARPPSRPARARTSADPRGRRRARRPRGRAARRRSAPARRSARRSASSSSASAPPPRGGRGAPARAPRSIATASTPGSAAPALAQRARLERLGVGALEVALGQPQPCARVAHPDLPGIAERAVEPALAQQVARLVECAALGQRADQHLDRAAGEHVHVLVDQVERRARLVLGVGHAAGAERQLGRVPRRRGAQPQRPALRRVVAQAPRSRSSRLVGVVGQHQRAHREVVGRAPAGARAAARRRRAPRGPAPRSRRRPACRARRRATRGGRARCAAAGVGGRRRASIAATRRARSSWRVGDRHQRVERGGLERQPASPVVLPGQLAARRSAAARLRRRRRRPARRAGSSTSTRAVAVARLAQRLAQALRASPAGRRRRRPWPAAPACAPRSSPGARSCSARSRYAAAVCGAPRSRGVGRRAAQQRR